MATFKKRTSTIPKFTKSKQLSEEYNRQISKLKRVVPADEWENIKPKRPKKITEASIRKIRTINSFYTRKTFDNPADLTKAYNKERTRILQFTKNASKRGYVFPKIDIPSARYKKLTPKDVKKLKSITPKSLYQRSTYFNQFGQEISGQERLTEEHRARALKGVETRRKHLEELEQQNAIFEQQRRKQDIADFEYINSPQYQGEFDLAEQIYSDLEQLYHEHLTTAPMTAREYRSIIRQFVTTYSEQTLIRKLSTIQDAVLQNLWLEIYYEEEKMGVVDTEKISEFYSALFDKPLSLEMNKRISDSTEQTEYFNPN